MERSLTEMIGCMARTIADRRPPRRQQQAEDGARRAVAAVGGAQVAAVALDQHAADPQAEPGAAGLARDEGLEHLRQQLLAEAGAAVGDRDLDRVVVAVARASVSVPPPGIACMALTSRLSSTCCSSCRLQHGAARGASSPCRTSMRVLPSRCADQHQALVQHAAGSTPST